MEVILYSYRFTVWPDETWKFQRAIHELFSAMGTRVEMTFSREGFEVFRSTLSSHGLTLREVERVPHHEPEAVD